MHFQNDNRSESNLNSEQQSNFFSLLKVLQYKSPGKAWGSFKSSNNATEPKRMPVAMERVLQQQDMRTSQMRQARHSPTSLAHFPPYSQGDNNWRHSVAKSTNVPESVQIQSMPRSVWQTRPSQRAPTVKFERNLINNNMPQVLPRYVVRCSMKYGRQRYGANLKLFGKQIRIGSKYTDTISASKVASSAKRFLRRDDMTNELYIEPSPQLAGLTCSVFSSRSSNEVKEVPVSSLLHNFLRAYNAKIAHKRFNKSCALSAKSRRKVKEMIETPERGHSTGLSQALKRNRQAVLPTGNAPENFKLGPRKRQATPVYVSSQPALKKQHSARATESMSLAAEFITIKTEATSDKASQISRHLSNVYSQVQMADELLTESLHNSPNLSLQSQQLAFASLSSLRTACLLLTPANETATTKRVDEICFN